MNERNMRKTKERCETKIKESPMQDSFTYMSACSLDRSRHYLHSKQLMPSNLDSKYMKPEDLAKQVSTYLKQEPKQLENKNRFFKSVTTKPIISNRPVKLLQQNYPLNQDEILNVCETKTFEIKNYYNYLYEEEIEKAARKIEERNHEIEVLLKMNQNSEKHVNTQFEPVFETVVKNQEEKILEPQHSKYLENRRTFNLKEKQLKAGDDLGASDDMRGSSRGLGGYGGSNAEFGGYASSKMYGNQYARNQEFGSDDQY